MCLNFRAPKISPLHEEKWCHCVWPRPKHLPVGVFKNAYPWYLATSWMASTTKRHRMWQSSVHSLSLSTGFERMSTSIVSPTVLHWFCETIHCLKVETAHFMFFSVFLGTNPFEIVSNCSKTPSQWNAASLLKKQVLSCAFLVAGSRHSLSRCWNQSTHSSRA